MFSGVVVGIMSGVFFTATTAFELWCLLPQVINAFKHKEEAQYAYIYRKLYACYNAGQEINKENIKIYQLTQLMSLEIGLIL